MSHSLVRCLINPHLFFTYVCLFELKGPLNHPVLVIGLSSAFSLLPWQPPNNAITHLNNALDASKQSHIFLLILRRVSYINPCHIRRLGSILIKAYRVENIKVTFKSTDTQTGHQDHALRAV